MAVNCVAKFNDENTEIRFLQSDTPYSGTIANQFDGAYFKFEMIENETIYFNLNIQPNTTNAINVAFSLYRKDGETFTNLGTSISDDFNNSFEYAATPAEYYICITTDWSVNYTLYAEFTDYPFVLIAECDAYAGEYMPPTEFARAESVCDSPVFYQIIEGTLPSGLEFTANGLIYGIPAEQDCEPAAENMPPSFTWWDEDENKERKSYGCEHRIVIRAALVDSPETYHDREFFVCVHNNWDQDRDHFMALKDQWETPVFIKPEDAPKLDPTRYDEVEKSALELMTEPKCDPCPEPEPYRATLEELKELTKMVEVEQQYQGLIEINDDGLCEICEVEDESTTYEIELETLPVLCEPCPEPVVVTGLKDIPTTLCSVDEAEEVVVEPVRFVAGIPEICYPGLLNKMINDKVCGDRPVCPSSPVYPTVIDEPFVLKSDCPKCEE